MENILIAAIGNVAIVLLDFIQHIITHSRVIKAVLLALMDPFHYQDRVQYLIVNVALMDKVLLVVYAPIAPLENIRLTADHVYPPLLDTILDQVPAHT
jgi:hypothetical protein